MISTIPQIGENWLRLVFKLILVLTNQHAGCDFVANQKSRLIKKLSSVLPSMNSNQSSIRSLTITFIKIIKGVRDKKICLLVEIPKYWPGNVVCSLRLSSVQFYPEDRPVSRLQFIWSSWSLSSTVRGSQRFSRTSRTTYLVVMIDWSEVKIFQCNQSRTRPRSTQTGSDNFYHFVLF